jgi:hypothetical protein
VGRWERGEVLPSPYFRERLCPLFGKTAEELGFVEDESQKDQADPPLVEQNVPSPSFLYDPTIPPLPNEGKDLIGRQELLDTLVQQLCSGKSKSIALKRTSSDLKRGRKLRCSPCHFHSPYAS